MKMKLPLLLLGIALLSAGCVSPHNTVDISGTPGMTFTGVYTCKHFMGKTTTVTVIRPVPTQLIMDSKHFDLTLHKEAAGDMTVSLHSGSLSQAVCGTGSKQQGVRVRVRWYGTSLSAF